MRRLSRPLAARPLVAVAALASMTLAAACGSSLSDDSSAGAGSSAGGGSVSIGLLVPKSGVYAPLGTDMENGFRLYLDQHGGQLGGRTVEVKLVDEGETPATGVPAAQGLIDDEVSAVVGIVNSATALGVTAAFNEARVPLVIANAGADTITAAGSTDYVWRTSFANGEISGAMGSYVAEQAAGGGVFLIAPDYAAGKEYLAAFEKTFTAAGGTVAGQVLTPFGTTTNYQPFLSQITQSGAEAVFAFYAGSEAVAFVKQYSELGLKGKTPLYSSGFLTEGGVLTAQGTAAEGLESSLHYSNQLDNPANAAFVPAYTAKYQGPPTVYSVGAYDAAAALDQALKTGTSGEQVVQGLDAITSIDSPRGTWSFTDTHGPEQTYYLRKVASGATGALVNTVVRELP